MIMSFLTRINKQNLIFIFVGFVTATILLTIFSRFNLIELSGKEYAFVNMEKIILSVNEELTKAELSNDEVTKKLSFTKEHFDSLLKIYSNKNNAVVFSSQKVIAGAKDITDYFNVKLLDKLKQAHLNTDKLNQEPLK